MEGDKPCGKLAPIHGEPGVSWSIHPSTMMMLFIVDFFMDHGSTRRVKHHVPMMVWNKEVSILEIDYNNLLGRNSELFSVSSSGILGWCVGGTVGRPFVVTLGRCLRQGLCAQPCLWRDSGKVGGHFSPCWHAQSWQHVHWMGGLGNGRGCLDEWMEHSSFHTPWCIHGGCGVKCWAWVPNYVHWHYFKYRLRLIRNVAI